MNARYLQREGFGMCAPAVDARTLDGFIDALDGFHDRLQGYAQDGNVEALYAIEEAVTAAGRDSRRERARARREARASRR